jgi:hypothetical protein
VVDFKPGKTQSSFGSEDQLRGMDSRLSMRSVLTCAQPAREELEAQERGYLFAPVRRYLITVPDNADWGLRAWEKEDESGFRLDPHWKDQIQSPAWPKPFRVVLEIVYNLGEDMLTRLFENDLKRLGDGKVALYGTFKGRWSLGLADASTLTEAVFLLTRELDH